MTPLSVIAFCDGRPGHDKQTRGVVQALASLTELEAEYIKIPRPGIRQDIGDWSRYLRSLLFPRTAGKAKPATAVIIGTGAHTHLPMLLYRRSSLIDDPGSTRVVTCMSPNPLLVDNFDLCFVPRHDSTKENSNIFITNGPPCAVVPGNRHDNGRGLILVGGLDRKSHHWQTDRVTADISTIIKRERSRQWTVSSSPRTPADTVSRLRELAQSNGNFSFFAAADTPAGWIEEQYARHRYVWVTGDSISMIYEALTAGCAVGILPVEWRKKDNKFQRSIDLLLRDRQINSFDNWLAGQESAAPQTVFNEAARCAVEILRRWWPERLQ